MKNEDLVRKLAKLVGIADAYRDYRGQPRAIAPESMSALLQARGFATEDADAMHSAIDHLENKSGEFRAPPVAVLREGGDRGIVLEVPAGALSEPIHWQLAAEQGEEIEGSFVPADCEPVLHGSYARCRLEFPELPYPGYHWLTLSGNAVPGRLRSRIICAPSASYGSEGQEKRGWGMSLQLYCLRSRRNWGIGDFTDLAHLARALGNAGADFVGINPLHALYPSNPEHASPYCPASRAFINYLYVDVEAVPEMAHCEIAQEKVASDYFQGRLADLRSASHVDYSGVAFLKLVILRHLYATFVSREIARESERSTRFLDFVEKGGAALEEVCLFYTLYAHHRAASRRGGWKQWPKALQDPDSDEVAAFAVDNQDAIRFYMYLQWLADEQLESAQSAARDAGMRIGIYRDLAVGVDAGGADMWRNQSLYCEGASVGAPPDAMAIQGQDWGLPPMDPKQMREEGYESFIRDLRENMRHCGALRLDHVMQLTRLWWTRSGHPSSEGAYVRYPLDDLLGIVALESHRSRCRVIGEDLGVVPADIRAALPEENIWSYKVMLFEKNDRGEFTAPTDYPERALATLTTHDLPTLPGYWRGADLLFREKLGLFPDHEVKEQAWQERIRDRQAFVDALKREGLYPDSLPEEANKIDELPNELLLAMEQFLARCSSGMISVQMEDWLGVTDPVNVPGTSDEYPNWRRRLPHDFEQVCADGRLEMHAASLDRKAARRLVSVIESASETPA